MLIRPPLDGASGDVLPAGRWVADFGGGSGTITLRGAGKFRIVTPAVGSFGGSGRVRYLTPVTQDSEILCRVTPAAVWSTEAFVSIGIGDLYDTAANQPRNGYTVDLGGHTSAFSVAVLKADVETDPATPGYVFTGSTAVWVRARKLGQFVYGKVWNDGTVEPIAWTGLGPIVNGPTNMPMFPMFGTNTGTAASAVTFDFDAVTFSDLRPPVMRMPASISQTTPFRNQAVNRAATF